MNRLLLILTLVCLAACQSTLPNACVVNATAAREKLRREGVWAEVIKVTFPDQQAGHAFALYDVGRKDSYGYGVFNDDYFSRKLFYRTHDPKDATWQLYGPAAQGEFLDSEVRDRAETAGRKLKPES